MNTSKTTYICAHCSEQLEADDLKTYVPYSIKRRRKFSAFKPVKKFKSNSYAEPKKCSDERATLIYDLLTKLGLIGDTFGIEDINYKEDVIFIALHGFDCAVVPMLGVKEGHTENDGYILITRHVVQVRCRNPICKRQKTRVEIDKKELNNIFDYVDVPFDPPVLVRYPPKKTSSKQKVNPLKLIAI